MSQGETRRASQPLGATRKAKPMASAACGAASTGVNNRCSRGSRVPLSAAQSDTASTSDSAVASKADGEAEPQAVGKARIG